MSQWINESIPVAIAPGTDIILKLRHYQQVQRFGTERVPVIIGAH